MLWMPRASEQSSVRACLWCGYDLRDQPLKPLRCPGCGHACDAALPPLLVQHYIGVLVERLTRGVWALLFSVLWGIAMAWAVWSAPDHRAVDGVAMFSFPVSLALVWWGRGVIQFRTHCQASPGWLAALATFYFWTGAIVAMLAVVVGALWTLVFFRRWPLGLLLCAACVALFFWTWTKVAPRRRAGITPFLATHAAELARRRLQFCLNLNPEP